MAFENDEMKNLQKLVKSSLIEINKLKLELVKVKNENSSLKNNTELFDLKLKYDEDLKNKDDEINSLKTKIDTILDSKDSEIVALKKGFDNQLNDKDSQILRINEDVVNFKKKLSELTDILDSKEDLILSQKNEIGNLSEQIVNLKKLNGSLIKMKESLDVDFNNFKNLELDGVNTKLKNALSEVSDKETKIQSITNDLKISENELNSLKREFEDFKREVSRNEVKLATALNSIDEKNAEIEKLNLKIESQRGIITDLKTNLVNKDSLIALQRELDSKDLTIKEKEVQIKLLKDKSVSKEDYDNIQNELSKKDLQLKRLTEVKDLFFELSDKEPIVSSLDSEIINNASVEDNYLLELNEIKKELEQAKKANIKFKMIDSNDSDSSNLIDEDTNNSDIETSDFILGSDDSSDEVNNLKEEIENYKKSISELEKIKEVYNKLTSPQLDNLTSIQSQIYHLLPDESMDTLSIKNYMNEIAFSNLSFGNTKNILKSLEKKGYVESSANEKDILFWKKLYLDES